MKVFKGLGLVVWVILLGSLVFVCGDDFGRDGGERESIAAESIFARGGVSVEVLENWIDPMFDGLGDFSLKEIERFREEFYLSMVDEYRSMSNIILCWASKNEKIKLVRKILEFAEEGKETKILEYASCDKIVRDGLTKGLFKALKSYSPKKNIRKYPRF